MTKIANNIDLARCLLKSNSLLKKIYLEFEKEFISFPFKNDTIFEFETEDISEGLKKNFFTLLMLSILLKAKIPENKIISYGKIIVALRQIVTSTDNIIDNEEKGIVKLNALSNTVVKNSFTSLICQDILTREALKVSSGDSRLSQKIFEELYSIAFSESLRDISLYEKYPDPKYILSNIHNGIGGKLLKISLIAPCYVEKTVQIENFTQGLYEIGMSLQAIDDLFDIDEDFEAKKINLATSEFLRENPHINEVQFSMLSEDFILKFLKNSLESSYNGFSILRNDGFPINKSDSKFILKKLFKLRGLEKYGSVII